MERSARPSRRNVHTRPQRNLRFAKRDWSEVDAKLKGSIEDKTFEGVGLLLCTAEGTFYKKAFGADTTETTHLLGSATKLASTTTIMTLVDDRLINIDDPIKKYLPQFGPVSGAITIRQLFAQLHAMPAGHPSIALPLQDNGFTLEESVNQIAKDDTVRYPVGEQHEYQPAVSYHIGGRIAEVVTGEVWKELFDERVRIPLDMQTSTYGETRNPRIGGGAKCALQDYGNLLQMHLAAGVFKGRRVLSEASVREMQKDQLNGAPFTPIGRTNGYGLSWWFEAMADGAGEWSGHPRRGCHRTHHVSADRRTTPAGRNRTRQQQHRSDGRAPQRLAAKRVEALPRSAS